MTDTSEAYPPDPRHISRWLWIAGLASILLGLAGIVFPFIVTLAVELLCGAVLVALGVVQVLRALLSGGVAARGPTLLFGVVALAGGAMLLIYPPEGVLTLTALLAAFFLVGGMMKLLASWQLRDAKIGELALAEPSGRGWLALSGALSLGLGLLLFLGLPAMANWALGLLLGVDLLFLGISEIALAIGFARAANTEVTA